MKKSVFSLFFMLGFFMSAQNPLGLLEISNVDLSKGTKAQRHNFIFKTDKFNESEMLYCKNCPGLSLSYIKGKSKTSFNVFLDFNFYTFNPCIPKSIVFSFKQETIEFVLDGLSVSQMLSHNQSRIVVPLKEHEYDYFRRFAYSVDKEPMYYRVVCQNESFDKRLANRDKENLLKIFQLSESGVIE